MKIIKRSGTEETFDITKIIKAVGKANREVAGDDKLSNVEIQDIANDIYEKARSLNRMLNIEEIQDMVEKAIMGKGKFELAKKYITYRYTRNLVRQSTVTDDRIFAIIEGESEEAKQENSNKNPECSPTQRDYIAGEVSKDLTRRVLLPENIVKAHDEGIIHFHDADYFAQHMHNCALVNLEDMLQNGTVISGTKIDKPHSFSTACNITTQIVAQVASSQYGLMTAV